MKGLSSTKDNFELAQMFDYERQRDSKSRRLSSIELDISENFRAPDEVYAFLKNYGYLWGQKIKGNKFAKPTLIEIINGLKLLLQLKLQKEHNKLPKSEQELYKK